MTWETYTRPPLYWAPNSSNCNNTQRLKTWTEHNISAGLLHKLRDTLKIQSQLSVCLETETRNIETETRPFETETETTSFETKTRPFETETETTSFETETRSLETKTETLKLVSRRHKTETGLETLTSLVFSERELKFMFAICHRSSVCLSSVVCL